MNETALTIIEVVADLTCETFVKGGVDCGR